MSITLRKIVEKTLPSFLSKKIIVFGESYKKKRREEKRLSINNGKPFIKAINVFDVSFNILLDPVRNSGVDESIAREGFWEKELSHQFLKYIHKDSVFLDIGANIGYHSLFVASLLKGSGQVYSFEPIPRLCKQLNESVESNKFTNIKVNNFGLAEKDGEHIIHFRDENMGGSSLLSLPNIKEYKVSGTELIKLKKLDSLFEENFKVDVIKIDVEGYEYEALSGASHILENNHPVIFMEFSPVFYNQESKEKTNNLISFLKDLGYSFFTMNDASIDLNNWVKEGNNANSQIDIICKVVNSNMI